jgi:hypothetical protein
MNRDLLRQATVIVTFIATVVVNSYANIAAIGGRTTGEISDSYPNFFTPAGYVFAVWSVIYLALAAFSIYQALPGQRQEPQLRRVGWLFVLTNLFNGAWIFAWHYLLIPLSWLIMIGLLITLLVIYKHLQTRERPTSTAGMWLVNVPFSIYTAWITVATIANTTVLLLDLGFNGGPIPEPLWSAAIIVVGALIAGYVIYTRRDVAFAGVIVWAYVGIAVKYLNTEVVAYTAGIMVVGILIALIAGLIRNQPPGRQMQSGMV